MASKSRHGKTALTQIKLSCKVDLETWRRVNKSAEEEKRDVAAWLRALITEAVWQVPLTAEDYAVIQEKRDNRQERD